MKDLDLATRLAIEDVPIKYIDATTRNDLAQFADCFTEDAVFDASEVFPDHGFPYQGREAIVEVFKTTQDSMELVCQAHLSTIIYGFSGQSAKVRYHLSETGKVAGEKITYGQSIYMDDLVLCEDNTWRIEKHVLLPVFQYTIESEVLTIKNTNPAKL